MNKILPVARGLGKPNHVKSCVFPVFRFFSSIPCRLFVCVVCLRLINWYQELGSTREHKLQAEPHSSRTTAAAAAANLSALQNRRRCRTAAAAEPPPLQNRRRCRTTAAAEPPPPFSADRSRRSVQIGAAVQCRSEPPFSADQSAQRSRCRECCRRYCRTDLGISEISCTWYLI